MYVHVGCTRNASMRTLCSHTHTRQVSALVRATDELFIQVLNQQKRLQQAQDGLRECLRCTRCCIATHACQYTLLGSGSALALSMYARTQSPVRCQCSFPESDHHMRSAISCVGSQPSEHHATERADVVQPIGGGPVARPRRRQLVRARARPARVA